MKLRQHKHARCALVASWAAMSGCQSRLREVDIFADYPEITPGRITYGQLRDIIEWRGRHAIGDVSLAMLGCYRDEGQGAARAGLELGLIDYGQASGDTE